MARGAGSSYCPELLDGSRAASRRAHHSRLKSEHVMIPSAFRPGLTALGTAVSCFLTPTSFVIADQPQTKVQEPGYAVKVFPQCGQAGVARRIVRRLDPRPFARAIACGPEEIWGASSISAWRTTRTLPGISRPSIPPRARAGSSSGPISAATPRPSPSRREAASSEISFAGSRAYFVAPPPLRIYFVSAFDPAGALGVGVSVPYPVFSVTFDPTGAFGGFLYLSTAQGVERFDPTGDISPFAPVAGGSLRFGPGGDWGSDLYVSSAGGVRISPGGDVALLPGGFGDFDWGPGPGFGGDMFARCDAGSDQICRIHPDGSRSLWATGVTGPFTFCGDELWTFSTSGCERVTFGSRRD